MKTTLLVLFATVFIVSLASADAIQQKLEEMRAAELLAKQNIDLPVEPIIDEAGGPDGYGYIYRDNNEPDGPTYAWVDISGTGTNIASLLSDDDEEGPLEIGFTFNYYGVDYTQFWCESNGCIAFTDAAYATYTNAALPGNFGGPMVCWLWDDFNVSNGAYGDIYYETIQLEGMNALVLSYVNVAHFFDATDGLMTGQAILFEDGRMRFQYAEFDQNWTIDSETIGIVNGDGSIYLQADFNTQVPNYPTAGTAIDFWIQPGDADVSGTITDIITGNPIPGASVHILNQTVQTDNSGYYEILGSYSGDQNITVTMTGYELVDEVITLVPGMNTFDFDLIPMYALDIEPLAGTTVPPNGGRVFYGAQLSNPTPFPSLMQAWTYVGLPDGQNYYGPLSLVPLNLQPGTFDIGPLQFRVPGIAPSGIYTFHAAIGSFPNLALAEDMFYFWKLGPAVAGGEWSDTPWDLALAGQLEDVILPDQFQVAKVYPNPFNPTATVEITLPEAATLNVRVYNITGQMVAELANGQFQAGTHDMTVDGSTWASGIYFVHTQVPGQINNMQKITLLK